MSIDWPENEQLGILAKLRKLPRETEWAEFKHNNAEPDEIGECLSALVNATALIGIHPMLEKLMKVSHDGTKTRRETDLFVGNLITGSYLVGGIICNRHQFKELTDFRLFDVRLIDGWLEVAK